MTRRSRCWSGHDRAAVKRRHLIVIGNVGAPTGAVRFPGGDPNDGLLELAMVSPRWARKWLPLTWRRLPWPGESSDLLERCRFRMLELRQPEPHERDGDGDGDGAGRTRRSAVTVEPAALLLRVPR